MRLLLVLLALAQAAPRPQSAQARPFLQADGVVRLLSDLEAALVSGKLDDLFAMSAARVKEGTTEAFENALDGGAVTSATVRERTRRPLEGGYEVLAEVLVTHGRHGRLATWLLTTRPRAGAPDRYELTGLSESAAIDGLLKLSLNTSKEFAVHNLVYEAPDLVLKMSSGSAFVGEDEGGATAIVLRGDGEIRFSPSEPAEQGQLVVFAGRPTLVTPVDAVFLRVNSSEFARRVGDHMLTPTTVDPKNLERAQDIFDNLSRRTYNLDLRDLSPDRWSLGPTMGSAVVEFKTRRYGWLTYARVPGEPEDVSLFDRARGHNLSSYASTERLATRGRFYSEDEALSYDVLRYGIDVTFDPVNERISGRGSVRIRIRSVAVGSLTFRIAESLDVSSVSSPDLGRLLALRVVGQNNIIVNLPTSLSRDSELVLEFVYSGRLSPQLVDREAAMIGAAREQGQEPMTIVPEPRFLYSNRTYWYPQAPVSDYATAAMRLRVPAEYQIIASGSLVDSSVAQVEHSGRGGDPRFERTVDFLADRPARYFSCVISRFVPSGRLRVDVPAVAPQMFGEPDPAAAALPPGVNLEVVSTPRMAGRNRTLPARVAEIIKLYAGLLGEAPYPDLTIAGVDENLPGGHSPAFFAIWLEPLPTTPFTWASDPIALDTIYEPFFLAHEVAHQWWGQAVGWKNYHEQWLSEGLAQYFAVMYAGSARGPDTMRDMLELMRSSAASYASQGPIYLGYRLGHVRGDPRVFRATTYNKSAVVLHMLRRFIGDEAFFAGLRRFYRTWRFHKAGTADLRAAFEEETPVRLERFFNRWILGTTLPQLRITSRVESATSAIVRVEQVGEVFDLPLSVTVQYADGQSEVVTILVSDAVVEQRFRLKGPVRRIVTRDDLTLADYVK